MPIRNRFQYTIATGRLTLPVAVFISLVLWAVNLKEWTEGVFIIICSLITYLLIELNTAFSLIRVRSNFAPAMFLLFAAACPFLAPYTAKSWIPVLCLIALFALFRSYESKYASIPIFHAFLCIGIGSMIMPHLLLFSPLIFLQMLELRSFHIRTFFAGIVGLLLPYWISLCYHLYLTGNVEAVYIPLTEAFRFASIDYSILSPSQLLSWGVILSVSVISAIQSLLYSFQDKVQTRILLRVLAGTAMGIIFFTILQPQHANTLFPLLLIIGSIMSGHLFALTFNRFTRFFLPITIGLWIFVCIFNLWMH